MSINQRFKSILFFFRKNENAFAEQLNVSRTAIVRVTKEEKLPGIKLLLPLAEMGIDINWLLTGDGEMLRENTTDSKTEDDSNTTIIEYLKRENELLESQLKDKERIISLMSKKT